MRPDAAGATWRILTPTGATGGVAVIEVRGEIDAVCRALAIRPVAPGRVELRSLAGVDHGLAARWDAQTLWLMPHGGRAVTRSIVDRLIDAGAVRADGPAEYPEAAADVESRMLDALARAASPMSIDLLLDQPRRWALYRSGEGPGPEAGHSARLNRLLEPPLVVMIGPTNVGKSTLTNALAGASVSIVSEEPGTTRDHVGVTIEMGGLVVRFADTPGLRPGAGREESEAAQIALDLAARADLVLRCGEAGAPPPGVDLGPASQSITVRMRADRGRGAFEADVAVSGLTGAGVPELVGLIRDRLVPPGDRADERPWKFWPG